MSSLGKNSASGEDLQTLKDTGVKESVNWQSWYKSGTGKFSAFLYLFRIDPYYLFISLIFVCIRRQSCYWSKQYNGFSRNLQENRVVLLNRSPNIWIWPPWRPLQSFLMYRSNRSFNMPPPGNPPGIWLFWKLLFKFSPTRAKMPFKCPTFRSIQVIKCPHPGDISQAQKWQKDGGKAFSCRTKSL